MGDSHALRRFVCTGRGIQLIIHQAPISIRLMTLGSVVRVEGEGRTDRGVVFICICRARAAARYSGSGWTPQDALARATSRDRFAPRADLPFGAGALFGGSAPSPSLRSELHNTLAWQAEAVDELPWRHESGVRIRRCGLKVLAAGTRSDAAARPLQSSKMSYGRSDGSC